MAPKKTTKASRAAKDVEMKDEQTIEIVSKDTKDENMEDADGIADQAKTEEQRLETEKAEVIAGCTFDLALKHQC